MKVLTRVYEVKQNIRPIKQKGIKIAFVPTMGALHQGHIELLKQARFYAHFVVLSIFVNPTQFGGNEDYDKYPRDLDNDILTIKKNNIPVDCVFAPSVQEMYPFLEIPQLTLPFLSQKLCGLSRPTHFDGVGLVVLKLLNIVQPDFLIMGQKDYQQTVIIQRLIDEFFIDTQLITIPTVRESDGLALSSRNIYLNAEERENALILYKTLNSIQKELKIGMNALQIQSLLKKYRETFAQNGFVKLDYLEILDAYNLVPIQEIQRGSKILIAIAAYIGKTRLIDNMVLEI